MPSINFGKTVKWYEGYWMRQYAAMYAPASPFKSDGAIASDVYRYIRHSARFQKSKAEREAMVADIRYYRTRWAGVFKEIKVSGSDKKVNEKVLAVLFPRLRKEGKM